MGNLAIDSDLTPAGPDTWTCRLSDAWEIWGPNGGYVAALALRAAQLHTGRARPANASVHFLGVATFDRAVTVTATTLRSARSATSLRIEISQDAKPILAAMLWAVDDGLDGLDHDDAPMPDVPRWHELPTMAERFAAAGIEPVVNYRFWGNFEQRPPEWIDNWEEREPSRPLYQNWMRFNEGGPATDPWTQAARLLLLVDLGAWPAVGRRHIDAPFIAPSIDVSCEFHRLATADEWFLLQAESPHAGDGLIGSRQQVWNDSGELLASGISHLLCKRLS